MGSWLLGTLLQCHLICLFFAKIVCSDVHAGLSISLCPLGSISFLQVAGFMTELTLSKVAAVSTLFSKRNYAVLSRFSPTELFMHRRLSGRFAGCRWGRVAAASFLS